MKAIKNEIMEELVFVTGSTQIIHSRGLWRCIMLYFVSEESYLDPKRSL